MNNLLGQNMHFFGELLSCGQELYYWEFDAAMQLIDTSCANPELLSTFLTLDGCAEKLQKSVEQKMSKPVILSNAVGFSWIAVFQNISGQTSRIYMIGPAFNSDMSYQTMMQELGQKRYSATLVNQLQEQMQSLPVIPLTSWMRYGLMLHFCVTGEKLEISDFSYPVEVLNTPDNREAETNAPKSGTWLAEQAAMQMIREGRLDYQKTFSRLSMAAPMAVPVNSSTISRQFKNSVISFITLATREAIRGGLNAEIAYYLGAQYIENVESCSTTAELIQINSTMYDDFVKRVHKVQQANGVSNAIQICCNYIEMHLSEKIFVKDLASEAGYSEYYIAQKFKKELGISVAQYVKEKRVEQGKLLLRSTTKNIQSIAEELGFCNSSHFSDAFRSVTGITPMEYRDKKEL